MRFRVLWSEEFILVPKQNLRIRRKTVDCIRTEETGAAMYSHFAGSGCFLAEPYEAEHPVGIHVDMGEGNMIAAENEATCKGIRVWPGKRL